jgi:hypothetical protein
MKTFGDLFDAMGGPAAVAQIINVKLSTATEMKRRGTIPVDYWPKLLKGAERKGILLRRTRTSELEPIDAADLMKLHVNRAAR